MSVLVLYRRVITGIANLLIIRAVNAMILSLVVYTLTYILLVVLQCRPTRAYWMQHTYPPEGYTEDYSCFQNGLVPVSNAVISVVMDFAITVVPMFLFWQLHMPFREKLALSILFGVGFS